MPRKKASDPARLYSYPIRTRVTETVFKRLETLTKNSNCQSVGQVARMILSKERIVVFTKDASMDGPMEELSGIKKEINAIGININQITHYFHGTAIPNQKMYHALKVADQYKKVSDKIEPLLQIISTLSKKWLQK